MQPTAMLLSPWGEGSAAAILARVTLSSGRDKHGA